MDTIGKHSVWSPFWKILPMTDLLAPVSFFVSIALIQIHWSQEERIHGSHTPTSWNLQQSRRTSSSRHQVHRPSDGSKLKRIRPTRLLSPKTSSKRCVSWKRSTKNRRLSNSSTRLTVRGWVFMSRIVTPMSSPSRSPTRIGFMDKPHRRERNGAASLLPCLHYFQIEKNFVYVSFSSHYSFRLFLSFFFSLMITYQTCSELCLWG